MTFYDDTANCLRFFAAAKGAITTMIQLPYLLHLPHVLISFIITQQCTCSKVACEVMHLSGIEGVGVGWMSLIL